MSGDLVLDPEVLDRLQAMLGEGAAEVMVEYLSDVPELVAELSVAYATGDPARLRRAAHTLRSTSELLGAVAVAEVCAAMESRMDLGDLRGAGALLALVAERCRAATTALSVEMDRKRL